MLNLNTWSTEFSAEMLKNYLRALGTFFIIRRTQDPIGQSVGTNQIFLVPRLKSKKERYKNGEEMGKNCREKASPEESVWVGSTKFAFTRDCVWYTGSLHRTYRSRSRSRAYRERFSRIARCKNFCDRWSPGILCRQMQKTNSVPLLFCIVNPPRFQLAINQSNAWSRSAGFQPLPAKFPRRNTFILNPHFALFLLKCNVLGKE